MGDRDWLAAAEHDLAFHRALSALAGNSRMSATYEQMLAQTLLLLQTAGSANARLRSDMPPAIHRELLAALLAGDVEGAARRHRPPLPPRRGPPVRGARRDLGLDGAARARDTLSTVDDVAPSPSASARGPVSSSSRWTGSATT